MQSPAATSKVSPPCQLSPDPARTKKTSSSPLCVCAGVERAPAGNCIRRSPTCLVPAAVPRSRQVPAIGPTSTSRRGTSSQLTGTASISRSSVADRARC